MWSFSQAGCTWREEDSSTVAAPPAPGSACSMLTGAACGSVPQPASSPLAKSYSRTCTFNDCQCKSYRCTSSLGCATTPDMLDAVMHACMHATMCYAAQRTSSDSHTML